jgi:hypothetical protein
MLLEDRLIYLLSQAHGCHNFLLFCAVARDVILTFIC